jgi:hypothetical protein
METKRNKWFIRATVVALSMATVCSVASPSWARSYGRQGEGRYDRDYYDDRYDDDREYYERRLPYGSYNPYDRTITIPVPTPDLPPGTEKVIEGVFEMFLRGR